MCTGCERFLELRGHVIRAAAVVMSKLYELQREDVEDLEHAGICRVLERKSQDPGIVDRPNSYFHRIVKHLQIDRHREQRRMTGLGEEELGEAERHDSLARQYLAKGPGTDPERVALINQILAAARGEQEREALMSFVQDESAKDFARRMKLRPDAARKRRLRVVAAVARRLKGAGSS